MSRQSIVHLVLSFFVGAGFVCLWQVIADQKLVSPIFLPGPDRAFTALVDGFGRGELQRHVLGTLEHMFYGWFLASLIGIAIGSLIGISAAARAYLAPTLEFFRPLPASAVFPVAIALLGLSDEMVLLVIAFGGLWPTMLATIHGFAAVEPRLYEVARVLGLGRWSVIRKIALPNALADILAGMRLGLTVSLILAVVGEILASVDGLGQWVVRSARAFRSADLFAGVILLGVIGYVSAQMLVIAEHRLLRWRAPD